MKIIDKITGKQKNIQTYRSIIRYILSPIRENYTYISDIMQQTIEKYKDEKLIKFIPDNHQIKRIFQNPDYLLDVPRYIIKGYDEEVTNIKFDTLVSKEFYKKFIQQDKDLIDFINKNHPILKIIL